MLYYISLFSLFAFPAHAYLDPGTGSVIAQVVIAASLGVMFQAKRIWQKFKTLIANRGDKSKS